MMCYRDKWFCAHYRDCAKADECDRPLTEQVIQDARATGLWIDQHIERPECHVAEASE